MAEAKPTQNNTAGNAEIQIDMEILQKQEKTATSLCDKYGVHVFNEKAAAVDEKTRQERKEQWQKLLSGAVSGEKNSDREEILRRVMAAETQTVVKKEYETQMQKNQGLSMLAFGLTGVLVAGAFLFYIEKQRKKKQRRGRKHETDDNRYGYEEQFL